MRWSVVALIFVLASTAGLADPGGEHLSQGALPGFKIGYQVERGSLSMQERVPAGESVELWTRMVTTQRFGGLSSRVAPRDFLQGLADGFAVACPGGRTTAVRDLTVSGRPAAELRADCPMLSATGKPETFFARAIAGATDIHVVQVAFRSIPTASETSWAEAYLRTAVLCGETMSCKP